MEISMRTGFVSLFVFSVCLVFRCSESHPHCSQLPGQRKCSKGFVTDDEVSGALPPVGFMMIHGHQYLFPNINFTCRGQIITVCFKGNVMKGENRELFAEFQIWRRKDNTSCYVKLNGISLNPMASTGDDWMFSVETRNQLHFQNGDVLGMFVPSNGDGGKQVHTVPIFVEDDEGVPGYSTSATVDNLPMHLDTAHLDPHEVAVIPHIKVAIEIDLPDGERIEMSSTNEPSTLASVSPVQGTTVLGSTVQRSVKGSIVLGSTVQQSPIKRSTVPQSPVKGSTVQQSPVKGSTVLGSTVQRSLSSRSTVQRSTSSQRSPTHPSSTVDSGIDQGVGGSRSDSDSSGIIGGVVGTIAVAMAVAVLVAVAVFLLIIIRRRRKGRRKPTQGSLTTSVNQLQLDNPVYTGEVSGRYEEGSDAVTVSATGANSRRAGTMASDYEEPLNQSGKRAPDYQLIDDDSSVPMPGSNPTYHVLEHSPNQTTFFNGDMNLDDCTPHYEGTYVPTGNQRRMLSNNVGVGVYSTLAGEQQVSVFFEETGTYWRPASRADEIYEQLAAKKYREISRNHIQITDHLGSGQYGTVHKGIWQSEGGAKEVAVKMLKAGSSEDDKVKFLQEAAINGQFRHANVVRLMGVVTLDEPVMIVLELLKNGDLRQYLINMRPIPGEMVPSELPQTLLGFCREIAAGMAYLSRKGFVHRDLAARNILVAEDKKCKISDFGMSRDLEDTDYYVSRGGKVPVKWTAPEALHYKKYTSSSDVWSYGVVLYEIWSLGHKPFEGYTNTETIQMADDDFRLLPPPGCPRAIYKMMIDCWHPDRLSRPTFEQLGEDLSEPETELLVWTEEDAQSHPLTTTIGAALEAGQDLYTDLQQKYKTS